MFCHSTGFSFQSFQASEDWRDNLNCKTDYKAAAVAATKRGSIWTTKTFHLNVSPDIGCVSSCVLYLLNCTKWRLNSLSCTMKGWVSDFQMFRTRKNSESHCAWSSLVKGGKGLYLPNCQTNLVIDLDALSLLFCIFMNTTAYHLGRY